MVWKRDNKSKMIKQLGLLGTIPILLAVGPLVGFFIGKFLDEWLETDPWLKFILLAMGFIASGKEIWKNLDDGASYSAPVLIEQFNKPVVVIWTGQRVVGLNPNTGSIYWQHGFEQKQMVINIATPVFYKNYLFVSNFFDGSMLLKLNTDKLSAVKVWRREGKDEQNTDALHSCISTPLLKGDFIYGVDSYGELRCLELKSGDRIC